MEGTGNELLGRQQNDQIVKVLQSLDYQMVLREASPCSLQEDGCLLFPYFVIN